MVAITDTFYQKIQKIIEDTIRKMVIPPFQLFIVTDSKPDTYKVNIQNLHNPTIQYDDVSVMGVGLGNFKGLISIPVKDDIVMVAFLSRDAPIVLGNLYATNLATNIGSQNDIIPNINKEELLITNKNKGATIHMKETNRIIFNKGSISIARVGDEVTVTGTTGEADSHTHTINITGTIATGSDNIKVD